MKRSLLFVLVGVMTVCGVGVTHGKECQDINLARGPSAELGPEERTPRRRL